MSHTLQDLRDTLDQHASTVHSDVSQARVAAVHGRARKVRRQRATGVGLAAVVAVVAATAVPILAGGDRSPSPADRTVLGQVAPETFTSLGWTYRFVDSSATPDSRRVTRTLEPSELPRLVSWTTASGFQEVRVRSGSDTSRFSEEGDFEDFVLLPPSYAGRISVTGDRPGVGLAVYEVDTEQPPAGIGEGALTFREVAGRTLLGATLGQPGQASIEVDVTPEQRMLWVGDVCQQAPSDARLHIAFSDEAGDLSFGGCGAEPVFDPGGSAGIGVQPGRHAGQPSTLRMWVTRDGEPVADGEIAGLRLGLGVYTPVERPAHLAGIETPTTIEYDGHVWILRNSAALLPPGSGPPPEVLVPDDDQYVVVDAVKARGTVRHTLTVDGQPFGSTSTFAGGRGVSASGGGPTPVPGGSTVSIRLGSDPDHVVAAGLAVYRLAD